MSGWVSFSHTVLHRTMKLFSFYMLLETSVQYMIHSTSFILYNACGDGEFCKYKCHCNQQCAKTDGLCPIKAKCDMGWFGLRCQYVDLASTSGVTLSTSPVLPSTSWLTDRNDSTCNNESKLKSVTVNWNKSYRLTWLRISLAESSDVLFSIKIKYDTQSGDKECQNLRFYLLRDGTVDIRCEDIVVTKRITLLGNITSLCSLYVSGGRNIAYQQMATKSSTYTEQGVSYIASLAVDGNTTDDFNRRGRCARTAPGDPSPRFDLRLQSSYVINRFVLYGIEHTHKFPIRDFRLLAFNELNQTVFDDVNISYSFQAVDYIEVNTQEPINYISLNQTRDFERSMFLCELEAYGECPPGRWSLPCTRQCNSSCPTSCHIDDGSCSQVCAGYSYPPVWTRGDFKTGQCKQGCDGYSGPPYCTQEDSADWSQLGQYFGAGFGAGATVVILLAVFMLTICCVYRKRRAPQPVRLSQQHVYDLPCSTTENIHAYGAVQSDIETKAPTAMEVSNYCNLLVNTECGKVVEKTV